MGLEIDGLTLWQAQQSTDAVESSPDVISVMGQDSDETLLTTLEAVESMTLTGLATGIRLTGESGYSSDPQTALSQWIQQFESLCWPSQGSGWSITDDERSRTLTVTVEDLSWTFSFGSPVETRWSLDITRGEAVMDSEARSPNSPSAAGATPNSSTTVDGNDIGTVTEKRTTRRIDLSPSPIAFGGTDETVLVPDSGVVQQWTLTGRVSDTDSNLRTLDSDLRGLNGGNQSFTYQTGMPGGSYTAIMNSYDSTYNAGSTAHFDWAMTLTEGVVV